MREVRDTRWNVLRSCLFWLLFREFGFNQNELGGYWWVGGKRHII